MADFTFGYETIPSSYRNILANNMLGCGFTAGDSGDLSKITAYCAASAGTKNAKAVITDASFNILSNGISDAVNIGTTPGWVDFSFSTAPSVSASTQYYLWLIGDASYVRLYYDGGGSLSERDTSNSYASPTDPTDASSYGTDIYGIYATGSSGGAIELNVTEVGSLSTISGPSFQAIRAIQTGDNSADSEITGPSFQPIRNVQVEGNSADSEITGPSFQPIRLLQVGDVTSQSELGEPSVQITGAIKEIDAADVLGSSEITESAFTAIRDLSPEDVVSETSVGSPVAGIIRAIFGDTLSVDSEITPSILTIIRSLAAGDVASPTGIESAIIGTLKDLNFSDLEIASSMGVPDLEISELISGRLSVSFSNPRTPNVSFSNPRVPVVVFSNPRTPNMEFE